MELRQMEIPTPTLVEEAIDRGDSDVAKKLLRSMEADWLRNKDYSINWITSLLSFIGRRLGEPAVEEALRDFGDRYLAERRAGYAAVTPEVRLEGLIRAMKANGADVEVAQDDDKYVASFRCGSGGKLIDDGAYGPPRDYLTLHGPTPVTFGRETLPVYCAHCSVNNEIEPIESTGVPVTIEFPPERPGERCVHHVYKDPARIPVEIYRRVGKGKPA
ncbi:MAG TPA: hypothetical protein VJ922_02030 [Actinomycetota bacterium]|nr:hypothetical protein [Actinomycetota bacterium]